MTQSINGDTTYQVKFGDATTTKETVCIIFVRGERGSTYSTILLNGYGYSTSRCNITDLGTGSGVTFEIQSDIFAVNISIGTAAGTTREIMGVFMLYGDLPTITAV